MLCGCSEAHSDRAPRSSSRTSPCEGSGQYRKNRSYRSCCASPTAPRSPGSPPSTRHQNLRSSGGERDVGSSHRPQSRSVRPDTASPANNLQYRLPRRQVTLEQPFPLLSAMHSAQARSDTSNPAKFSIVCLPHSQIACDPIGSSTSVQGQPNYAGYGPPREGLYAFHPANGT